MLHLREIRLSQKLSVPELSRLSGVPLRTIQDMERRGEGRLSTAWRLASALGVTLDQLYDGPCADSEPAEE